MRLPIGTPGGDYNRVKCFVMLKDVEADGGCLGLYPYGLPQPSHCAVV